MTDDKSVASSLGSDRPVTAPTQDAFGYASFARRIARAVSETPSPEGLVMAIHGPWGSGKSTLLNFVKHEIATASLVHRPIVIDFNPWWFEGPQQLAAQFLTQFSARLPQESEALHAIGDILAEYADAIGKVVASTTQIPYLGWLSPLLKRLKRKPKDVPKLKAEISRALRESQQRFLFVIDDIDRLPPEEVREIFKVVKALADFPNVIYLLAFDRKAVVDALESTHRIDGEAYLEKIVQAPFSLPSIDRERLRIRVQRDLGELIDRFKGPDINKVYWMNVYMEGLDPYIRKPRDIVRVMNALTLTYPAVAGEVNPVDFIALEFLRVFEAKVYDTIRNHPDMFTGASSQRFGGRADVDKEFHDDWLSQVPEVRREHVRSLVKRLFPRLQSVWGKVQYNSTQEVQWRNTMRVCSREYINVYFQFGVADDALSRHELNQLLSAAESNPIAAAQILEAAAAIKRPSGFSKARDYMDRLRDCDKEISPQIAAVLAATFSTIGASLLSPRDEEGATTLPNSWRLIGVLNHLLVRMEPADRPELIRRLVMEGHSIGLAADVIESIDEVRAKPENAPGWAFAEVSAELLLELKKRFSQRLHSLSATELLEIPAFKFTLHRWMGWDDPQQVIKGTRPLFENDELLPLVLEKYLGFGSRQVNGDVVASQIPRMDVKALEPFVDIFALEGRVQKMLRRPQLTENQRLAGVQCLSAISQLREG